MSAVCVCVFFFFFFSIYAATFIFQNGGLGLFSYEVNYIEGITCKAQRYESYI